MPRPSVTDRGGTRPESTLAVITAVAIVAAVVTGAWAVAGAGGRPAAGSAVAATVVRPTPVPGPTTAPEPEPTALQAVLGLGDSVPQGANCGCPSFVVQVGSALRSALRRPVAVRNLAVGGLTSGGLLDQVGQGSLGAPSDQLTLVTIGANDFDSGVLSTPGYTVQDGFSSYGPALRDLRANVSALLTLLARPGHGPIFVTGYWNVFLDGAVGRSMGAAYARDSDALTVVVNAALREVALAHRVTYVNLYQPFKAKDDDTELLADDGDHPSNAGHAVITQAVLAELRRQHLVPRA